MENEGILHVIDQLGASHKQALSVIAEQSERIRHLEAALSERSESQPS